MSAALQRKTSPPVIEILLLGFILILAFALRFWQLDAVPPGWRDDELINSLVISQKVVDGDWAVYYADASGHEALYHALNAVMLALFGPGVPGIRWLSAGLGTISIFLTYLVGRRLFGSIPGLLAAAALALSFWSLMYSRIGIRHILTPVLALATFYFFLRGLGFKGADLEAKHARLLDFFLASIFMGLGFYTYFASRGVPLILFAFCLYILLFARERIKKAWPGLLLLFGLGSLMAIPLVITLASQPESEARVAELAVPLVEGLQGNFDPLGQHILITLNMYHADGDDEWLYNIPHRPVFGLAGALFFWSGVLVALILALHPLLQRLRGSARGRRKGSAFRTSENSLAATFLLLWWIAGIFPAFISVPPASMGHTILAQPAVYILATLPVWWLAKDWFLERRAVPIIFALLLLLSIAIRDLPDYFVEWPQRGMTRFLYRADIHEAAAYLSEHPDLSDFGITGLLAGPWDKIALNIDAEDETGQRINPRWYDPQRVLLLEPAISFAGFPDVEAAFKANRERIQDAETVGGYRLFHSNPGPYLVDETEPICFENGLCWLSAVYDPQSSTLNLAWRVQEPLQLPEIPLISNPPPPGVYAGPRLQVFAQLLDDQGDFLVGDDGLWIDPQTLKPGDLFIQMHRLEASESTEGASVVFGLYDPKTGDRWLTADGQDHIQMEIRE